MRWNTPVKRDYYHGQKRVGTKFALFPISSTNGKHVWLETATIIEEYKINPTGHWEVVDIKD